jgi:hypothetical protein
MAEHYKIVFDGKILPGETPIAVQGKLIELYKGNRQAVSRLFSGRSVVIKNKLDRQAAERYKAAFRGAGAEVRIVPESSPASPSPENAGTSGRTPPSPASYREKSFNNPESQLPEPKANAAHILNVAAAVIVIAIFACLGLRFWASNQLDNFIGIDHVAANKDTVAIHAAGKLYLQSHSGKLKQRIDLRDLGVTGQLADLEILADGTLLIGAIETKGILSCSPQTNICVAFAPTGYITLAENFKFMVDEPRQQLYIADTNNHRLIIQNLADSTCLLGETASKLSYPNDMARGAGDMMYLCDTNRLRIIPLKVGKDSVSQTAKPIASIPLLPTSPEDLKELLNDPERMKAGLQELQGQFGTLMDSASHAKPFAMAMGPDGNLWVIQLNTMISNGTINVISPAGDPVNKVELAEGAIPIDIISLADDLLVVDSGLIGAYTIDPVNHSRKVFGDPSFQDDLADIYNRRAFLEGLKSWGLTGTILLAVSAFAVMIVGKIKGVA